MSKASFPCPALLPCISTSQYCIRENEGPGALLKYYPTSTNLTRAGALIRYGDNNLIKILVIANNERRLKFSELPVFESNRVGRWVWQAWLVTFLLRVSYSTFFQCCSPWLSLHNAPRTTHHVPMQRHAPCTAVYLLIHCQTGVVTRLSPNQLVWPLLGSGSFRPPRISYIMLSSLPLQRNQHYLAWTLEWIHKDVQIRFILL